MKNILVSLVSDQTIPNLEFIKEKRAETDEYLFLTSEAMERKGTEKWIIEAANIDEEKNIDSLKIDPFSFSDIRAKLAETINDDDRYIVNLTGGTKITSLAVFEFFKNVNAEMYYLTGKGKYIKVFPGQQKKTYELSSDVSLSEYLISNGFSIENKSEPLHDFATAKMVLEYFVTRSETKKDTEVLLQLRKCRSKKNTAFEKIEGLEEFLKRISYSSVSQEKLSKNEVKYLTGDWFEEYLYHFLLEKFDIKKENIGLGIHLKKSENINEFDVLLMKNSKLYLFECKTSVYLDDESSKTFISETIYKSDSLRSKFGLFAQTIVFTLSELQNSKLLEPHRNRAAESRVKLIGGEEIYTDNLFEILEKI